MEFDRQYRGTARGRALCRRHTDLLWRYIYRPFYYVYLVLGVSFALGVRRSPFSGIAASVNPNFTISNSPLRPLFIFEGEETALRRKTCGRRLRIAITAENGVIVW